jgi:hypothetical protein
MNTRELTLVEKQYVKWMLERVNPALPPRSRLSPKGDKAQRRLDTAISIARDVASRDVKSQRVWAAVTLLNARTPSMYNDLANRLAYNVFHQDPLEGENLIHAWWYLYVTSEGEILKPLDWEIVYPKNARTEDVLVPAEAEKELLLLAANDGSFRLSAEGNQLWVIPNPVLSAHATHFINKIAGSELPIPMWPEGVEYN